MTYNFDSAPKRLGTDSVKWGKYSNDVLPMWVADMDFESPPEVIDRLTERIQHGVFGYPDESVLLVETIANWLLKRHSWKVAIEDIVLLPGVVTGMNLAAHAIQPKGSQVIIQPPVYLPFHNVAENAELVTTENCMVLGNYGYDLDFDDFSKIASEKPGMFLLCNPHNPTGRVFSESELGKLADICLAHNIIICSDEIHSDLIFSNHKHIPIASLGKDIGLQTITLMSPSKTFNLAGFQASFAIIHNPELRERIEKARQGLISWVNLLGRTAMQAAYELGEPWLEELMLYLETNRNVLSDFIPTNVPNAEYFPPQGTYLGWFRLPELQAVHPTEVNNSEILLKEAKLALNEGKAFGCGGDGFVRLNFGCPKTTLLDGLARLSKFLSWMNAMERHV